MSFAWCLGAAEASCRCLLWQNAVQILKAMPKAKVTPESPGLSRTSGDDGDVLLFRWVGFSFYVFWGAVDF